MNTPKKLYRVNEGKIFAGICTGLAEYANMDVTVVRVLWVAMTLFAGAGLILYIICIFIIPLKPETTNEKLIQEEKNKSRNQSTFFNYSFYYQIFFFALYLISFF